MQARSTQYAEGSTEDPVAGNISPIEPEFLGIGAAVRWSGIGRTNLFGLIKMGEVRSINLRKKGRARGRRLIHLPSLRAYLMTHAEGGQ